MYLFTEFYNNSVFGRHDKYLIFNLVLEKQRQKSSALCWLLVIHKDVYDNWKYKEFTKDQVQGKT